MNLGAGRSAVRVAASWQYSCALLEDGKVKCWGRANNVGQLGLGDTKPRSEPGELGDNLPEVDLGGEDVVDIDSGGGHTCAVLADGEVKCWGQGFYLGLGESEPRGDGPDEMGGNLPAVDFGSDAKALAVAAGPRHSCAVLDDDTVRCWDFEDAKSPVPLDGMKPRSLVLGEAHACASFDDGAVRCWGSNAYGQLGTSAGCWESDDCPLQAPTVVNGLAGVQKLAAGRFSTCALLAGGAVTCWGEPLGDRLGAGEPKVQPSGAIFVDALVDGVFAVDIDSTDWNTCALLDDHRVSCWGSGLSCFRLTPDGVESDLAPCGPVAQR